MDLNSYKYGSNSMSNVSGFLDNVNKTQLARNQANRGGNKTMVVPSFNILNPATRYEGTIMSQRTNEVLLNAKRNNVYGGSKSKKSKKTNKSKKSKKSKKTKKTKKSKKTKKTKKSKKTKKTKKTKKSKKSNPKKSKFNPRDILLANDAIDAIDLII